MMSFLSRSERGVLVYVYKRSAKPRNETRAPGKKNDKGGPQKPPSQCIASRLLSLCLCFHNHHARSTRPSIGVGFQWNLVGHLSLRICPTCLPLSPFTMTTALQCTLDACLQQVIRQIDNNPADQFAACKSLCGAPVVSTPTPPVDVTTTISTTTVSYTDIVIELGTTTRTYESTITSYASLFATATEYTIMQVNTITTTTTTVQPTVQVQKRKAQKAQKARKVCRGKCGAHSSTSSTAPTSVSSTTSAAPEFPIAPNCPSLPEYSSACECIGAVSTTSVVTAPAGRSTTTVHETISITVPSTRVSSVTVGITTVIIRPETTTLATTVRTATASTTTVTTTAKVTTATGAAPSATQTGKFVIVGGPYDGQYLYRFFARSVALLTFTTDAAVALNVVVVRDGGSVHMASDPLWKMHLNTQTERSILTFFPPSQINLDQKPLVSCLINSLTGLLDCVSSDGHTTLIHASTVEPGLVTYIQMALPNATIPEGGIEVKLRLAF